MLSLIAVAALAVVYLGVTSYVSWRRLRHIPGPFVASLTKWWMVKKMYQGQLHTATADANKKYGSLVRIGPNELATSDPDALRMILNVRSPYQRSDWYNGLKLDPHHHNILSEPDNKRHHMLRTKMSAGYAGKENPGLEHEVDDSIESLCRLIETKYLSTPTEFKPMDLSRKIQYLMLDTITRIGFGKPFGYLEQDEDIYSYIKTTEQTVPFMFYTGAFPGLMRLVHSPLMKPFLPSDSVGLGAIMSVAKKVVAERFKPDAKDEEDMLGSFVRHGLSQHDTEVEIMVQILAGTETTGGTLRMILLYLLTNPRVMNKLLDEIRTSNISDPITQAEAKSMPYLQAVIKEGQRVLPPAAGLMLKETPSTGGTISGYQIPPGTKVGPSVYGLFHDPKLWGADAKVFRPERWFEGTPEAMRVRDKNIDLIFSHGRYSCLGKNLAWVSMNKVFVQLLRRFHFTLVDPLKPCDVFNVGVFVIKDMNVRVDERVPRL